MTTRLVLIRHGETDWNVEGRWQGQADVPLNARGREQAAQIAQSLINSGIAAIYSSDLTRTRDTAELLSQATQLGVVRIDPRLREIHQGEWQGLHISEIQSRYTEAFRLRRENPLQVAPPGGETTSQVRDRVLAAVNEIIQTHPGETVAIVSHGFALAVILADHQGIPIEEVWDLVPENAQVNIIDVKDSGKKRRPNTRSSSS